MKICSVSVRVKEAHRVFQAHWVPEEWNYMDQRSVCVYTGWEIFKGVFTVLLIIPLVWHTGINLLTLTITLMYYIPRALQGNLVH